MKDRPQKNRQRRTGPGEAQSTPSPEHGRVLGELHGTSFDTELEQAPGSTPGSTPDNQPVKGLGGLKKSANRPAQEPAPLPPPARPPVSGGSSQVPASTGEDALLLPPGGLVAMRRSGGLRFTTAEVLVYEDGRVLVAGAGPSPGASGSTPVRKLRRSELAQLRMAIENAGFPGPQPDPGRQSPDTFAYELAASVNGATYSMEAFDGAMPMRLAPLIRLLAQYMG